MNNIYFLHSGNLVRHNFNRKILGRRYSKRDKGKPSRELTRNGFKEVSTLQRRENNDLLKVLRQRYFLRFFTINKTDPSKENFKYARDN